MANEGIVFRRRVFSGVLPVNAKRFSRPLWILGAAGLVLGAGPGCARSAPAAAEAVQPADAWFPLRLGERTVRVQLAVLPAEQQRGLMFRRSLGEDEGMLFIFSRPQPMGFWMRNTTLPLDIGYLDAAGELKEVYPLHPLDERTVASHGRALLYALEMNQGWFRRHGVAPGARLDLAAMRAAMRARGLQAPEPTAATP